MTHTPHASSIRKRQNQEEQENKIASYIGNQQFLARNEKKNKFTRTREHFGVKTHSKHLKKEQKKLLSKQLIYGHNYSLKFPLQPYCRIPFHQGLKEIRLKNNSQFFLELPEGFVKQTTRNLIVYPKFRALPAQAGNSVELQAILRASCQALVKQLQERFIGLRVLAPGEPSTQEYAVKDAFAKRLDFTFKNDLGKFDKSERIDSDGHKVTGGEIEYFRPEHADMYLRMPIIFSEALKGYSEQIKLHLSVLQGIGNSTQEMHQFIIKELRPSRQRMPTSFKKSATVKAVN